MRIRSDLLQKLRLASGWTQKEVAEQVEIDIKTYRNYESGRANGAAAMPLRASQYETLRGLAALFGLSAPEDLLEGELSRPTPTHAPAPPLRLRHTTAPVFPVARYVHREREEKKALNRLRQPGAPVVIHGPEHFGASTFLGFLLHRAASPEAGVFPGQGPVAVLRLSAPDLLAQATTEAQGEGALPRFLRGLARRLLDLLSLFDDAAALDARVAEVFCGPGSAKAALSALLEQAILQLQPATPDGAPGLVVLAIEKADRLLGTPLQDDVFSLFRSWCEAGSASSASDDRHNPWTRLRLLTTVSTEPSLLESLDHSSFFALAAPIRIEEMDAAQLTRMAALARQLIDPPVAERARAFLGGSPYLMQLLLREAEEREAPLLQVLRQEERALSQGEMLPLHSPFASHLQHLRVFLEQQPHLATALRGVLRGERPRFEDACRLYSKGLVVEDAPGTYRVRCPLYERYFRVLFQLPAPEILP